MFSGMSRAPSRFGPYEVLGELGRGGLGVVYRARHPRTGGEVALKVLLDPDPRGKARFQREARTAARLRHPGIVSVQDLGEEDGRPYLVMELVEGESLASRLRRGPLAEEEAARLGAELAEALACAHAAGVLHRDVKPANVLIDRTGRARLTDFGLAREQLEGAERLTRTGVMLGTPGYMAPEQMDDASRAGPPADVYGLGASLYQLLTGSPPFVMETLSSLVNAVLNRPPAPPSVLRPGLDARLDRLCLACLAKDPAERPTAADLARALSEWRRARRAAPVKAARGGAPAVWVGLAIVACGGAGALAVVLGARPRASAHPAQPPPPGPRPPEPPPAVATAPPPAPEAPLVPEAPPEETAAPAEQPPPAPAEPYPGFARDARELGRAYPYGQDEWVPRLQQLLGEHPEEPLWQALYTLHTPDGWRKGLPLARQLQARGLSTALEHKVVGAYLLEGAQDARGALELFDRGWTLDPEGLQQDDNYFHFYGNAVARSGARPEEREQRLRWAIEHNRSDSLFPGGVAPNRRYHFFYLSEVCRELGRTDEALTALEGMYQLDPSYPQASMYLGNHFRALGDRPRATGAYQRAVDLAEAAIAQLPPEHPFVRECTDVARACRAALTALEKKE